MSERQSPSISMLECLTQNSALTSEFDPTLEESYAAVYAADMRDIDAVERRTLARLKGNKYSSISRVVPALYRTMYDSMHIAERAMRPNVAREVVAEISRAIQASNQEEFYLKGIVDIFSSFATRREYVKTVVSYAHEHKLKPATVVRKPQHMSHVVAQAYGGFKKYESKIKSVNEKTSRLATMIEQLPSQKLGDDFMLDLSTSILGASIKHLPTLAFNPFKIAFETRDYLIETAHSSAIFIRELAAFQSERLEKYRKFQTTKGP